MSCLARLRLARAVLGESKYLKGPMGVMSYHIESASIMGPMFVIALSNMSYHVIQFEVSVMLFNNPLFGVYVANGPCRCDARHPAASCVSASVPAVENQFAMILV